MKLPELPILDTWTKGVTIRQDVAQERMKAYGEACYRAAVEDAAKVCDVHGEGMVMALCAAQIRSMK